MLYLGIFLMLAVMVALFCFSSLLIGIRVTMIIWVTAFVVMGMFASGFYWMMGGTL